MHLLGQLFAPEDRGLAVVTVEGDRVTAIDVASDPPSGAIGGPDAAILPGLIDIQVNGAYRQDFSDPSADVALVSRRLLEYGVTAFLPTIITSEPAAYGPCLENVNVTWTPGTARVLGVHIEGPFLNPKRTGTHNKAWVRPPDLVEVQGWLEHGGVRIVTLAPELPGADGVIRYLTDPGVVVSLGHSDATYSEAAAGAALGASLGTHLFNAMPPLLHRAPGLAGFLLAGHTSVSLICDGVHVAPEVVALVARIKAPDELVLITDALAGFGEPIGRYELAGIEFVSDGVVGRLPDGTLSGSLLPLNRALKNLVGLGVAPAAAVQAATANPAKLLGLGDSSGRVEVGRPADLVVVDSDWEVIATIVGGALGYERSSRSRPKRG